MCLIFKSNLIISHEMRAGCAEQLIRMLSIYINFVVAWRCFTCQCCLHHCLLSRGKDEVELIIKNNTKEVPLEGKLYFISAVVWNADKTRVHITRPQKNIYFCIFFLFFHLSYVVIGYHVFGAYMLISSYLYCWNYFDLIFFLANLHF